MVHTVLQSQTVCIDHLQANAMAAQEQKALLFQSISVNEQMYCHGMKPHLGEKDSICYNRNTPDYINCMYEQP